MTDASGNNARGRVGGRGDDEDPSLYPLPDRRRIWGGALPFLKGQWLTRFLVKLVFSVFRNKLVSVRGLDHVLNHRGAFILVLNHSQALEVLLVPALLFFARGGKRVHFMADWNYRMIPLVDVFYRCGQVITLTRKPAKPLFLDFMRPWFAEKVAPYERAAELLRGGAAVGIFPEGTINRGREYLLKGYSGAAQLSLSTGCSMVPCGIRFPRLSISCNRIPELSEMELEFGAPLVPPARQDEPSLEAVRGWHSVMMTALAELSGKRWVQTSSRRVQKDA